MRVAIVCNLRPPAAPGIAPFDERYIEWDDPATIAAMRDALARDHEVAVVEQRADLAERLAAVRPEIVFNVTEGLHGADRESEVPALLDRLGIPFTGSSASTLRTCLDKAATKDALRRAGLPTPAHTLVHAPDDAPPLDGTALIVKPLHEGSSKGIYEQSVVRTPSELRAQVDRVTTAYRQPAIVETFLEGREFTVPLLGNGPAVETLPIVEIELSKLPAGSVPIYGFEAKWLWDSVQHPLHLYTCPAAVTAELARDLSDLARRAFHALGCRDWCRVDLRLDAAGRPHILELNPLPGIVPDLTAPSAFTLSAHRAGLPHAELVRRVLDIARLRCGLSR